MATNETRHTHNPLVVTHETEERVGQVLYRMTVSNSRTGQMQFTMEMPIEDAREVAKTMLDMVDD